MAYLVIAVRRAVVDAGPLLSALVLNFARNTPPERQQALFDRSRIADYLVQHSGRQRAFVELFQSIVEIQTTSHVIGELQGLQELHGDDQHDFWQASLDWLARKKLDEKLIRLLDLNSQESWREAICRIGPCDAGLVELALRGGTTLLTDDRRTLAPLAWGLGVDCRVVRDLLPEE
jgi:hypothetical protein